MLALEGQWKDSSGENIMTPLRGHNNRCGYVRDLLICPTAVS